MSKKSIIKKAKEMHRISVPIYRDTMNLFFGTLDEAIEAAVNDGIPRDQAEYTFAKKKFINGRFRFIPDYCYWVILLPEVPESIAQFGTMVHELEHFVFFFLKERGMEHVAESDEAYAYLFEYMYCESMRIISELKEKENGERG